MQPTSSELQVLTVDGQHQMLVDWNNTPADYPRDKCMHELFEQRVLETPDALAVAASTASCTCAGSF